MTTVRAAAARLVRVVGTMPPAAVVLVAAVIVLPAITWTERTVFDVGGVSMNARVATYFVVAAIAGVAALPIAIRLRPRPVWLVLMATWLGWLLLTSLAARQSLIEWVPTTVRFLLYFSAALVFYDHARSRSSLAGREALAWFLPIVVLAMAVVPSIAGIAEVVRGDAPFLNGAPRISGSMPRHPVAYSLVLAVSVMATVAPALIRGRSLGAVLRWLAIAGLILVIFATYTRLTVVMVVGAAILIAALLSAPAPKRASRVAGMLVAGAAIVVLAQPLFEARFIYAAPISSVIDQPNVTPAPGSTLDPRASRQPGGGPLDVEIDASLGYRIKLMQRAITYLLESPIIGHGPGSFDRLNEVDTGITGVAAHNDALLYAVETGIPGLVIYALVLLSIAMALWPRGPAGSREVDALIVGGLVVLGVTNVGGAIHNPTYFVEVQLPIWMLVGASLGFRTRSDTRAPSED